LEKEQNIKPNPAYAGMAKGNGKVIFFTFLALLFLSVLVFTEWPLISVHDSAHQRVLGMKWILFPHVIFGLTGLVLGPFQFSSRIRRKNLLLHRRLGKIYVVSILLAAFFSILVMIKFRPPGDHGDFLFENLTQASVWGITTVIAWITAKKRQIALHKIWMSRSYGVTLIFIFSRVLNPFPFFRNMDIESFGGFLWFLIVLALIIPELILNGKLIFSGRKTQPV
jgi:uncharacterized membrane protein